MQTPNQTQGQPQTARPAVGVPKTNQPVRQPAPTVPGQVKEKPGFSEDKKKLATLIVAGLLVVSAGVGTGYALSGYKKSANVLSDGAQAVPGAKLNGEIGLADEATFRDSAEGILETGGIDGEGTHHLVREGGESQNVYLTSTVIDLESFTGKKVTIWGETISARNAGWLMDVGKVKVTN